MKARRSANSSAATKAGHYIKFVEWSDADQAYVGRCPALFAGAVHGHVEAKVYKELCDVVAEWIIDIEKRREPLPAPSVGGASIHRRILGGPNSTR
ncbi:MAG TPA: hypothetical protein VG734_15930 [Lacunisphaera sp.]|nr:hypothetical protein [Lacunisphaera sp.]